MAGRVFLLHISRTRRRYYVRKAIIGTRWIRRGGVLGVGWWGGGGMEYFSVGFEMAALVESYKLAYCKAT